MCPPGYHLNGTPQQQWYTSASTVVIRKDSKIKSKTL